MTEAQEAYEIFPAVTTSPFGNLPFSHLTAAMNDPPMHLTPTVVSSCETIAQSSLGAADALPAVAVIPAPAMTTAANVLAIILFTSIPLRPGRRCPWVTHVAHVQETGQW
ncbi:hypothetical protein AABB02_00045 [Streptomyces rimosus]|uniref:hypothetical protein n=1 Tax=Streptomyces rimosus TaxID=1927 RepID=UPI0031E3CF53